MMVSEKCDELTDKNINLGIYEFTNQQKSLQKGLDVKISLDDLQLYITRKFKCSSIDMARLTKLSQTIITQRNNHSISLAKGTIPQLFSLGSPNLSLIVTPPTDTRPITVSTIINPKHLAPPSSKSHIKKTHKSLVQLPEMPSRLYPRTLMNKPNDMSQFYYKPTSDQEEFRSRNRKHGTLNCEKDLSCPPYMACDIDKNKCLSTDIIGISSWIDWNGKRITGSGKTLIEYLLTQGVPLDDIMNEKIPTTYNIDDYIDFIREAEKPSRFEEKNIVTASDIPVAYSTIIQLGQFTISTKNFPPGLTMIPDFIKSIDQSRLMNYILKNLDKNSEQYGYIYDYKTMGIDKQKLTKGKNPPDVLSCLARLLFEHKFTLTYPNQITVSRYTAGQGTLGHSDSPIFEDIVVCLSLGSAVIMKFSNNGKIIDVPIIPGCLVIMSSNSKNNWKHHIDETKSDTYKIQGFPDQHWVRSERISVTFRSVRPIYQG